MQAQSGDCQLLSSCVGDWNQTRTRAAACVDARHVEILEAAFPGGAFHPGLKVCFPIYREALRNTLTTDTEGRQLQTLRQVKEFLYGDQALWLKTSDQPQNSNVIAENMF
eukprot:2694727-Heterocapsa_arctica.AAC.1